MNRDADFAVLLHTVTCGLECLERAHDSTRDGILDRNDRKVGLVCEDQIQRLRERVAWDGRDAVIGPVLANGQFTERAEGALK